MKKKYEISIKREFNAAHNLRGYKGKCENLHGHNWIVEACVSSETLDKLGMVMDFHDLKEKVDGIIKSFDHTFLNDNEMFKELNPTSENIASIILEKLVDELRNTQNRVEYISVWETQDNCATVRSTDGT